MRLPWTLCDRCQSVVEFRAPMLPTPLSFLRPTGPTANRRDKREWLLLNQRLAMKPFVAVTILSIAMSTQAASLNPDIVIVNAVIHTMDEKAPRAEALAISDNRIAAVGSTAEIRALAGKTTRTIDAGGKLVLPGF